MSERARLFFMIALAAAPALPAAPPRHPRVFAPPWRRVRRCLRDPWRPADPGASGRRLRGQGQRSAPGRDLVRPIHARCARYSSSTRAAA